MHKGPVVFRIQPSVVVHVHQETFRLFENSRFHLAHSQPLILDEQTEQLTGAWTRDPGHKQVRTGAQRQFRIPGCFDKNLEPLRHIKSTPCQQREKSETHLVQTYHQTLQQIQRYSTVTVDRYQFSKA